MSQTKVAVGMLDATGTPGSGNFLRGDGTWNASTGGWEFVESITASTSATIDLGEGNLAAGYNYIIDCQQVDNSADLSEANSPKLQFGTGGTPTYQTSGYTCQTWTLKSSTDDGVIDPVTSGIAIVCFATLGGASAGETWDAIIDIPNPAAATKHRVISTGSGHASDGILFVGGASGLRTTDETVTGLRILPGTGTFISGLFILSRRKIA